MGRENTEQDDRVDITAKAVVYIWQAATASSRRIDAWVRS